MNNNFFERGEPKADSEQTHAFEHYRISVLQPDLIRVETSANGAYNDARTQAVRNRLFPKCEYSLSFGEKQVVVTTKKAKFYFDRDKGRVTEVYAGGRRIILKKEGCMPGTARTLDFTFGNVKLGKSVVSRHGAASFEDDTLVMDENGDFKARANGGRDEYVFAAPSRIRTLELFYMLTGRPPLIPRYALGNWWSRFYPYSAEEYLNLADGFKKDDVPFTRSWTWTGIGRIPESASVTVLSAARTCSKRAGRDIPGTANFFPITATF